VGGLGGRRGGRRRRRRRMDGWMVRSRTPYRRQILGIRIHSAEHTSRSFMCARCVGMRGGGVGGHHESCEEQQILNTEEHLV
jgi:hypothetical protein